MYWIGFSRNKQFKATSEVFFHHAPCIQYGGPRHPRSRQATKDTYALFHPKEAGERLIAKVGRDSDALRKIRGCFAQK
jgi:hypothetical protein